MLRAVLNTVSGTGAATRKTPEEVEVAQEEEEKFSCSMMSEERDEEHNSTEEVSVAVGSKKLNVSSLGTKRNVLCPDELTVTSQLTESAATVSSASNQMSYMATPTSLPNENNYKTATVATRANEKEYSAYTQYQLDELDSELLRFESQQGGRQYPRQHNITPYHSERPVSFSQSSVQSFVGDSSIIEEREEEPRKPSARELEIMRMRERLFDIEREQRLRYRQDREMENMTRFDSYPYWDSADEHRSLYLDSLEEDGVGSREDIMRRRRRGGRIPRNRGRRRTYYKH